MAGKLEVSLPSDTEIQLTRTFDAPKELVWRAFTEPELLRRWWGRRGSTMPVCEIDLRVGGTWRMTERGADGSEHPFRGEYLELEPPDRIVQTFIYDVPPMNEMPSVETATLTEQDGRTTVTAISKHPNKEARDAMLNSGMEAGAGETYDRLEELLATVL